MAALTADTVAAAELVKLRMAYNRLVSEAGIRELKYTELREEAAANLCALHYADTALFKQLCDIILRSSDSNAQAMLQELAWRDERLAECIAELQKES